MIKLNVIHIISLKQALNYGLFWKKLHRIIKFNSNAWLKPYIYMNTDLYIKKSEKWFWKKLLINNAVFVKTLENVIKHRDIKLFTIERKRNYLVSESSYQTTKIFTIYILAIEGKEKQILVNKLVYLGLAILEISKILMHELWYESETKIWWKNKIVLYGYRQFHYMHKNKLLVSSLF